jgi:hypothetical protein
MERIAVLRLLRERGLAGPGRSSAVLASSRQERTVTTEYPELADQLAGLLNGYKQTTASTSPPCARGQRSTMRGHAEERTRLLHGPYAAPPCRVSDVLTCERYGESRVEEMSAGRIPCPSAAPPAGPASSCAATWPAPCASSPRQPWPIGGAWTLRRSASGGGCWACRSPTPGAGGCTPTGCDGRSRWPCGQRPARGPGCQRSLHLLAVRLLHRLAMLQEILEEQVK